MNNSTSNKTSPAQSVFSHYLQKTNKRKVKAVDGLAPRLIPMIEEMEEMITEEDGLIIPKPGLEPGFDESAKKIKAL